MDRNLALEAIRVTEAAALSCARLTGRGDEKAADQAAVDAMRRAFNALTIDGTIVIGEGERDEAPMLYIGEKVGAGDRRWISLWIRWKERRSAPMALPTLSLSSPWPNMETFSIVQIPTWTRSPSARRERRCRSRQNPDTKSQRACRSEEVQGRGPNGNYSLSPAPRSAHQRGPGSWRAHSLDRRRRCVCSHSDNETRDRYRSLDGNWRSPRRSPGCCRVALCGGGHAGPS